MTRLDSIISQITRKETCFDKLEHIQELPYYFDSFTLGYQQEVQSILKTLSNDIGSKLKKIQDKSSFKNIAHCGEASITISFFTYLIHYKVCSPNSVMNVDYKLFSTTLNSIITSSKFKEAPIFLYKICSNCLSELCSYNANSLNYTYEAILFFYFNSQKQVQDLAFDIFTNIAQIPPLLKVIHAKKHTGDAEVISFLISLIEKFIAGDNNEIITDNIQCTPDERNLIEMICSNLQIENESVFQEAKSLLLFTFNNGSLDNLHFQDFLLVAKKAPQFFIKNVSEKQIDFLKSGLLTTRNSDIENSYHTAFIELLLSILIKDPAHFLSIFHRLDSNDTFEWCIPELIKEIFTRNLIPVNPSHQKTLEEQSEAPEATRNDSEKGESVDSSDSECSEKKDGELEDLGLDKSEEIDIKSDIGSQIFEEIIECFLHYLLGEKSVSSQITIFEALGMSYDALDAFISKMCQILKSRGIGESNENETEINKQRTHDFFTVQISEIIKESPPNEFEFRSHIPETVALLIKWRETNSQDIQLTDDQIQAEDFLKFLSLVFLSVREDYSEALKSLGFETENLEEALLSYDSDNKCLWKSEAKQLMKGCLDHMVSRLMDNSSLSEHDYLTLKTSLIGYISLGPISDLEDFVSSILEISDVKATKMISEALQYTNANDIAMVTHILINNFVSSINADESSQEYAFELSTSLLKSIKWNKERIIDAKLGESLHAMANKPSNLMCIKLLSQIIILDKENGIDDSIKGEIIKTFVVNKELSSKIPSEVIAAITFCCKTLNSESVFKDKIEEVALVPNLLNFIEGLITEENKLLEDKIIEAFASVLTFFRSAFDLVLKRVLSNNQQYKDIYLLSLGKYLEQTKSISLEEPLNIFSILFDPDFLSYQENGVSIGRDDSVKFITKQISSSEMEGKLIEKLAKTQVETFETISAENKTILRDDFFPLKVCVQFVRKSMERWIQNYKMSGICERAKEAERNGTLTDELKLDTFRAFRDQMNEFAETFPPITLKISYLFSTLFENSEDQMIGFTAPLFFRVLTQEFTDEILTEFNLYSQVLSRALYIVKLPENDINDKNHLLIKNHIPFDDYSSLISILNQMLYSSYQRGKKLYEEEGFDNEDNIEFPDVSSDAFFEKLCSFPADKLKTANSEDEKKAIERFLYFYFQFAIEHNCNFPDSWNNNEILNNVVQATLFYKQSESSDKVIFNNVEEKKWHTITSVMVAMSCLNQKNNRFYVRLLKLLIEKLDIKCNYDIPILNESFTGRLDSLAIRISEGLAECNGESAITFLKQFAHASKSLNELNTISACVILQPWSEAAGKLHSEHYVTELITVFLSLLPGFAYENKWARSAIILFDNLTIFSKSFGKPVEEIMANEFDRICSIGYKEEKGEADLISKMLIMILKPSGKDVKHLHHSLLYSCIKGVALYRLTSIRSLLHIVLTKATGLDEEFDFLEDAKLKEYDCIVRIGVLLSERKEILVENREYLKNAFFEDAFRSCVDQVSIAGWIILAALANFEDLPTNKVEFDENFLNFYKAESELSESDLKKSYSREQLKAIMETYSKPYTTIHKLIRFNASNPKEFADILSIYARRVYHIKNTQANDKVLEFNGRIGSFDSTILFALSSINIIRFKSFEEETMKELLDDDSNEEVWNRKALPFFVYLILSRSDKLELFSKLSNYKGKLADLINNISNGFPITETCTEDTSIQELLSELSKKGCLEAVVNNIIQFAINNSNFEQLSAELLNNIFVEADVWLHSKTALPNVLWGIYSMVEKQENKDFIAKPIQTILEWDLNVGATFFLYESLTVLEQICSKVECGSIEKLAVSFKVYNEEEKRIDFDEVISRVKDASPNDLIGALFVFGRDRVSEATQSSFSRLLSSWVISNKERLPIVKKIFKEPLMNLLHLSEEKVPTEFQMEAVLCMTNEGVLSDDDLKLIVSCITKWIDEKSLVRINHFIVNFLKSENVNKEFCNSLLPNILDRVISLIGVDRTTIKNIIETIQSNVSRVNEQIKDNQEISSMTQKVIEGENIFENADKLVNAISKWNVKDQEAVKDIADEIKRCVDQYHRLAELASPVGEICQSIQEIIKYIKIKVPQNLLEEESVRNLINKVINFAMITETELPDFKSISTLRILQQIVKVNPNLILPYIYAYPEIFTTKLKEAVSVVAFEFISSKFKVSEPVLVRILAENNFEKLFNDTFDVEELVDVITYLASTQSFNKLFEVAEEKLISTPNLSENASVKKIFTAMFCFLVRPLSIDPDIVDSIGEKNINDVLHKTCFRDNFYFYFNKLTVEKDVKKKLFIECILLPLLKSPKLFMTRSEIDAYQFDVNPNNLPDLDEFIESIAHKNALLASFNYDKAEKSRESVIRILQKKGIVEPEYKIEREDVKLCIDFRICSEFNMFMRISDSPMACLSFYQKEDVYRKPKIVYISMPTIRHLLEHNRSAFWRYTGFIQNESEAMKLISILTLLRPYQKYIQELISFIIMKYPQASAHALVECVMNSAFRANISMPILVKGDEIRSKSTMRYIKLMYHLSELFPGLFTDHGPSLVANCICSMSCSQFKWVKYVRGLITQYVTHISSDVSQSILEKNEELMKAIDEKERHFGVIAQKAFELFGEIGKDEQEKFVEIFSSVSIFDYYYLYPSGVSANVKLWELGAFKDDTLNKEKVVDKMINNIVRNFQCFVRNDDGSWVSFISGVYETIEKLVSVGCSTDKAKEMALFALPSIMLKFKDIRLATISLLHTCIKKLDSDGAIAKDSRLVGSIHHQKLFDVSNEFHSLLTKETNKGFVSIFAACTAFAFGYEDKETNEALNGMLVDAWAAWNQKTTASMYVLLPIVGYSSLDFKEVTGMDFVPLLATMTSPLDPVDFSFIRAFIQCAARDWGCPRDRLALLCPNGIYPMAMNKDYNPKKEELVRIYRPEVEKRIYFFDKMFTAMAQAACD